MQTTADLKYPRSGTLSARPRFPSAAILFAVGMTATVGTVAVSASRSPVEREDASLVEQCDRASIAASGQLRMVDHPDAAKAAVRRERERAFNACLEQAAIRGATAQ